jgi:hypothetical protein
MPRQVFRACSDFEFFNSIGQEATLAAIAAMSGPLPIDGVIGRPSLWIAEDFWVLRFRLMVKRGPW